MQLSDEVFAAVAEPRRRVLIELLAGRRMAVNELVVELGWPQPAVSKQLAVLRQAGLVRVERKARQKIYEMNPEPLKTIHDWTRQFERLWEGQLDSIKQRAEAKARAAKENKS